MKVSTNLRWRNVRISENKFKVLVAFQLVDAYFSWRKEGIGFIIKGWNYELVISDCNVLNNKYELIEIRTRMRQFLAEERYVFSCLKCCNDRSVKDEFVGRLVLLEKQLTVER